MPDQALSQCDAYLRGMKGVAREAVSDTAGAAQAIAAEGLRCVSESQPACIHAFICRLSRKLYAYIHAYAHRHPIICMHARIPACQVMLVPSTNGE